MPEDPSPAPAAEPASPSLLADPPAEPTPSPEPSGDSNPFHSIFANNEGGFVESWQDQLQGDEYADLRATAANYTSLSSLLQGLKDSKTAAMAKTDGMVRIPGEGASDEDRAAFRSALGVPESANDYEIKIPDNAPEGFEFEEGVTEALATKAHELNIAPDTLNELVKFQVGLEQEGLLAQDEEIKQWQADQKTALESEFGNQYQEKVALASRAAQTFGLDPNSDMFADAETVKAFAKIGDAISEDRLVSSESMKNPLGPEAQVDDIINNPQNQYHKAYNDPDHPQHEAATAMVESLMKQVYPYN